MKPGIMPAHIVVFLLDGRRFGLRLSAVERVVHMVEITPLPKAPSTVMGIVNMEGRVIPIFNIRMRFGLEEHEADPDDHIVIACTRLRTVGIVVDEASGILDCASGETIDPETIFPGIEYIGGVVTQEDGMILIHDLDLFLSIDEAHVLDGALQESAETAQ